MQRKFEHDIMPEIKQRWSTRAIESTPIARDEIMALLEAAKYAPSCYNEQPWRFLIADDAEKLDKMRAALMPANQAWANNAPVLLLIASSKHFALDGRDNYWNMFDAGTAFGFLALEAQKRGLAAHAMGGYDADAVRTAFGISDDLNIITIVAIGHYGDGSNLSEALRDKDMPAIRKETSDLLI